MSGTGSIIWERKRKRNHKRESFSPTRIFFNLCNVYRKFLLTYLEKNPQWRVSFSQHALIFLRSYGIWDTPTSLEIQKWFSHVLLPFAISILLPSQHSCALTIFYCFFCWFLFSPLNIVERLASCLPQHDNRALENPGSAH